ncbi:hypothetical protein DP113_11440 [Brasilonema octagenarum UFV-E1]|uniref:Uncharacterized protein n=1 Tax=Brasilonema sennae CENA114 TaxID=415709 RepID=A0A856MFJ6_9CYAN|nr:hypothetical protein [Brasilonema sennae]QDL08441.1 hypothetical protein DP114_11500 [Brasilonema sennae CENA114]QDL14797.1 hypothetical protein DP113_11440 [Brasilonema octagenarum UFV-E1]
MSQGYAPTFPHVGDWQGSAPCFENFPRAGSGVPCPAARVTPLALLGELGTSASGKPEYGQGRAIEIPGGLSGETSSLAAIAEWSAAGIDRQSA